MKRLPSGAGASLLALVAVILLLAGCASPSAPSASAPTNRASEGSAQRQGSDSGPTAGVVAPNRNWSETPANQRPGLATTFGERRVSKINQTEFKRDSRTPCFQTALHYNDRAGLDVLISRNPGSIKPTNAPLEARWCQVSYGIRGQNGQWLPTWTQGGWTWVEGRAGERYAIVLSNRSPVRREFVVSVDGLDVLDGQPASVRKRGYILDPGEEFAVEGFRTSSSTVAAFRFGSVTDSYSQQRHGTARNVGVIGLAVFDENNRDADKRTDADPFPSTWATPPRR